MTRLGLWYITRRCLTSEITVDISNSDINRFDEMLKAASVSSDAIKADPFEADSTHCPFYARFDTPIFDYYQKHPEYSGRFAKAMAGWRKSQY